MILRHNNLIYFLVFSVAQFIGHHAMASTEIDVALYYGSKPRVIDYLHYDWVVLQDSMTTEKEIRDFSRSAIKPIAYLSVGEVAKNSTLFNSLQQSWIIGENSHWNSVILDLTNEEVVYFIVQEKAKKLAQKGFQGFFLDTMDSYLLTDQGKADPKAFEQALGRLVAQLREQLPNGIIISNRGFEAMPYVLDHIDALAFESWFSGFDPNKKEYKYLSENDRNWLKSQIDQVLAQRNIPVIAIDYAPVSDVKRLEATRNSIMASGYIPWVSDPHLVRLGLGRFNPLSRRVLGLHADPHQDVSQTHLHRFIQMPLEYLGYYIDYVNLNYIGNLNSEFNSYHEIPHYQYAGIIVWPTEIKNISQVHCDWLLKQHLSGTKIVFFGFMPQISSCQTIMDGTIDASIEGSIQLNSNFNSYNQFEGKIENFRHSKNIYLPNINEHPWVTLSDASGKIFSPVVHGDWGGLAVYPYIFEKRPDNIQFWLFNPIEYLQKSLNLSPLPVPDVTTESGRRILTSHIDGDGFVSVAEDGSGKLSGEVMLKEIFLPYPIPRTVSVIEGEVGPKGLYPYLSPKAEVISKKIFQLPWVELASHTYSHPFFWGYLEGRKVSKVKQYGYHMRILNYKPTLEREIKGSINYIDNSLSPKNKKVEVFLWSGDANPGPKALETIDDLNLLNVNGGNTKVLPHTNTLTSVWPIGKLESGYRQIYAPVMNENVYTGEWLGPYYGYRNVIKTFELLESPRRLKPISIYYHFYSASKPAALNALKSVYEWSIGQPHTAMYLSEYAQRANTFFDVSFLRTTKNSFKIKHPGVMNTYRIDQRLGYPDLEFSHGVIGFTDLSDQRYIHTHGSEVLLSLTNLPPKIPFLDNANAVITQWKRSGPEGNNITVSFKGAEAIEAVFKNASQCRLSIQSQRRYPNIDFHEGNKNKVLKTNENYLEDLELEC